VRPRTMSSTWSRLHARRYEISAILLAAPALWAPLLWLLVGLALFFAMRVTDFTTGQLGAGEPGTSVLLRLPLRLVGGVLMAIPQVVLATLFAVLAMLVGFGVVGVIAGAIGVLAGLIAHHDAGALVWADAQASIAAWAPRLGFAAGAFFLARRAITRGQPRRPEYAVAGVDPDRVGVGVHLRTFFDGLGEVGLPAFTVAVALVVLCFALLSPRLWTPFSGYRDAAHAVGLGHPVNSALSSWVEHDTREALAGCGALSGFSDRASVGAKSTTLTIVFTSASGTNAQDDAVLVAARVADRVVPVVGTTIISAAGSSGDGVIESFPSGLHRSGVFRVPSGMAGYLTPAVPITAGLDAMAPQLKACGS